MKDKFCVSKTLAYLVLLVVAIVATFYATNYANSQKLTSESQAAGKCKGIMASVKNYPGGCSDLAKKYDPTGRTVFNEYSVANTYKKDANGNNVLTSACCVPDKRPTPTKGGVSCTSIGGKWYQNMRNGQFFGCGDIGPGYVEGGDGRLKTTTTETKAGYTCCVPVNLSTPTPGGKTCKQQGGDWYKNLYFSSCSDVGTNFTVVTSPSDQSAWKDYKCCLGNKLPTSTPVPTTNP